MLDTNGNRITIQPMQKLIPIDRAGRKISLSIKAREVDEDKKALAEFGSVDSGATLGDILGFGKKAE